MGGLGMMHGGGGGGGMRSMPTYRVGRTVQHDGQQNQRANECAVWFLGWLFAIVVPCLLIYQERSYRYASEAFAEVEHIVVGLGQARAGDLAHALADNVQSVASDPEFGISVPGALRVYRNTEYCQWQETSETKCERCHDAVRNTTVDCNCVTTYYYVKAWRTHRIPSMAFDQPGAHHNPMRNPFPSRTFTAPGATADVKGGGKISIGQDLLSRTWGYSRRVDWTLQAVPTPSFWQRWSPWPDTTRYDDIRSLRGVETSPAAIRDRFAYVGQGGYFFSPYQSSAAGMMFNYFVQYMEGSLMDWQLGDLMPSCTAGDIRVSFSVVDPEEISVAGKVVRSVGVADEAAQLGIYVTPKGHQVGMVHSGHSSFKSMMDAEIRLEQYWCLAARLALAPWAYLVATQLNLDKSGKPSRWWCAPAGVWGLFLALVWVVLWGPGLQLQLYALATPLLLVLASAILYQTMQPAGRRLGGPDVTKAKGG